MLKLSILISILTSFIESFTSQRLDIIIPYGIIVPAILFLPRLYLFQKFKNVVRTKWTPSIERINFFMLAVNAPASLILHELGFQYDRLLHFVVAFLAFQALILLFLPIYNIFNKKQITKFKALIFAFTISFIGIFLWEAYQYIFDIGFGTHLFSDASQDITVDFWEDIIFGFLGILTALWYVNKKFNLFLSILNKHEKLS